MSRYCFSIFICYTKGDTAYFSAVSPSVMIQKMKRGSVILTGKLLMTASTFGHIRSFHLPYLREFQRLGWETHVGCAGDSTGLPYIDKAIELPFQKQMRSTSNFHAAHLLRKLIQSEQYDLLIMHTSLAAFFTRLAIKQLRHRPRTVNTVHGYLFDTSTPYLKRQLLLSAERLTASETDILLTMNRWDYECAKRFQLGRKIEMISGMGVDFARLDHATREDGVRVRRELGISDDAFVLLYAAEFSERKSQKILIKAMSRLPQNTVLVLCGTGDKLEACKDLANKQRLESRVLFPGQIADMGPWYQMADAAVTASRSEGLPYNVMEAMHMKLPVVASTVKGHVDLIQDGKTGLLYPYGNEDACAKQVQQLMNDNALRERIRMHGRKSVEPYVLQAVLPEVMRKYLQA